MNEKLLAIYLNDHLAGATVGRELARRAAANNRGNAFGGVLDALAGEIDEDRDTLVALMRTLDVRPDQVKVALGWVTEKVGRLKLNGQLTSYSPLSRVVELEGLAMGVRGKHALWTALQEIAPGEPRLAAVDLPALVARAERQQHLLEEQRRRAAQTAFLPEQASGPAT